MHALDRLILVRPMRRSWVLALAIASIAHYSSISADENPGTDLVRRYHREASELAKRDLALKMIDTGVLKLYATTSIEVAKIFGSDWDPDVDAGESQSYGIVSFAKQPKADESEAIQVPFVGWYMVIYYNTKDHVVIDWKFSNVHK